MAAHRPISKTQYVVAVLWPAFLTAGLATTLFFTFFDPIELAHASGRADADVTRIGAYSVGFLCFWLLTTLSSALTQYFQRPSESVNRREPPQ